MAITKEFWSGSTDGKSVPVAATSTPGTLLHTAHATAKDEVWLYAQNVSGATRTLTIEFGGVTGGDQIVVPVEPGAGLVLVVPGLVLTNSQVMRAFADVAGVNAFGWVNRIA